MASIISTIKSLLNKQNASTSYHHNKGPEQGIGLRPGEINLITIDLPLWKEMFLNEKVEILSALNKVGSKSINNDDLTGQEIKNVEDILFKEGENIKIIHSGSTSFHKIKAKPILDLLIGFDDKNSLLLAKKRLFSSSKGHLKVIISPRVLGFYLIGKIDGDKVIAHYHLLIRGSRAWKEHNDIIYMLRRNWKILKEYENLKINLSLKYKNNRLAYTLAKKEFLHALMFRKQLLDQRNLLKKYSQPL